MRLTKAFMPLPRKGTETLERHRIPLIILRRLSCHYPARGRKQDEFGDRTPAHLNFHAITPQGDGNSSIAASGTQILISFMPLPRKGTETAQLL